MKQLLRGMGAAGVILVLTGTVRAQWSSAALFSLPSEAGYDLKTGGITPARGGGFHFLYTRNSITLRYRRYFPGGTLSNPLTVFSGTVFNARMAESLNGEIHVVFEDWSAGPNNVGWRKSSDGGVSFPLGQTLTSINCSKHPHITAFGTGESPVVLMSYFRAGTNCDESLWSRRYNGSTWEAEVYLGSHSHSEYDCFGQARSPADGAICRSYDPTGSSMAMRRYDGSWGPEISLLSGSWAVRQHMAVNAAGQVMILWDSDGRIKSLVYTPGAGPGPVSDLGPGGYSGACDVCWIPGTNDFYMVVARDLGGDGNFHVYGRKWSNGSWLAEESVQNNQANAFIVTPVVTADSGGNLYCVWEYWGSGKPQQWYAVKSASLPPGPTGTIAGTVRDNLGAGLPNACISVTGYGSTLTSGAGDYTLDVTVGTHAVEVYKPFYTGQTVSGVAVSENSTTTLSFTLDTEPPAQVGALDVNAGNRENHLSWTAPSSSNFSGVVLRCSLAGIPAGPADGQFLADLVGTPASPMSFIHSGLANGVTVYYSIFAYFQDASRHYAAGSASNSGTPAGPGDYDRDGDVDQADFGHFQSCLSGDLNPQTDPLCQDARFDPDTDVDASDLLGWQNCYSGPGNPSNPDCAG